MELLEQLCRARSISGFEDEVAGLIAGELDRIGCGIERDDFGNIIAQKGQGGKKIMLAAHMDEIGLMIKHINKEGFLHFIKIGGIDDNVLLAQRVAVQTKKGLVPGVIGAKPIHLKKEEERKKQVKYTDMFIDIGAKDDKQAKKMVAVGDPVCFESNFRELTKDHYLGKALDNRVGCYVALKVMEKLPKSLKATVYSVFTAQEEVGLKGARVSAYKLDPDYAFAVDTTVAGGMPDVKPTETDLKLGLGPAITITEAGGRGVITHPKLRELLRSTAEAKKIPYQVDVVEGGMTDAAVISLTREGVPSGVVSVPCRYIHSPSGVFNRKDVDAAVKLLVETIKKLT